MWSTRQQRMWENGGGNDTGGCCAVTHTHPHPHPIYVNIAHSCLSCTRMAYFLAWEWCRRYLAGTPQSAEQARAQHTSVEKRAQHTQKMAKWSARCVEEIVSSAASSAQWSYRLIVNSTSICATKKKEMRRHPTSHWQAKKKVTRVGKKIREKEKRCQRH